MKIALAVALAAVLFAVGCQKNEVATDSTEANERVMAKSVTVKFDGIVVHVLGNGVQRAVIPRLGGHRMLVMLPASSKTEIQSVFPGVQCPGSCEVKLGAAGPAAFRIVKADGQPISTSFAPDQTFTNRLIKLSTVTALTGEKPFNDATVLDPDIFATAPSANMNGNIVGWFELAGGSATALKYGCPAKFEHENDSKFRDFPATVTVTFADAGGLKLQVMKHGDNDWSDADDIPLKENSVTIKVNNDLPDSNGSHFKMLKALSTIKDGQGNPLVFELPAVISKQVDCTPTAGPVPGCSNSAWP